MFQVDDYKFKYNKHRVHIKIRDVMGIDVTKDVGLHPDDDQSLIEGNIKPGTKVK